MDPCGSYYHWLTFILSERLLSKILSIMPEDLSSGIYHVKYLVCIKIINICSNIEFNKMEIEKSYSDKIITNESASKKTNKYFSYKK